MKVAIIFQPTPSNASRYRVSSSGAAVMRQAIWISMSVMSPKSPMAVSSVAMYSRVLLLYKPSAVAKSPSIARSSALASLFMALS